MHVEGVDLVFANACVGFGTIVSLSIMVGTEQIFEPSRELGGHSQISENETMLAIKEKSMESISLTVELKPEQMK